MVKHHVLDWLISNHDAHDRQFLRTPEGDLVGIDKDQAFRYFGADRLVWDYHPNAAYFEEEPVYNTLWRGFSQGGPALPDPRTGEVGEFITHIVVGARELGSGHDDHCDCDGRQQDHQEGIFDQCLAGFAAMSVHG